MSTKTETPQGVGTDALLGDGADLAGRSVEYWGQLWTITEKNYLGDWNVERLEEREDGRYRIRSSIAPHILPTSHPHFARLVDSPNVSDEPRAGSARSPKPQSLE